ncbi:hypothetical protein O3G_MSEX013397 [Manduca sexta]|uniref:115 kDa protein in type-1 retrotransposable element R1DM n=1 Tax=Manduca sexta TaxID=7130 RepID=A0A922CXY7_MANSE|nr:hypothetical protein O3G_MSEX013397 [Manduca sexta]
MGKILEKMVMERIKWHIIPRMSTRQFGFMPQRSTEDSLYILLKHIRAKLTEKKIVTVVSLDIEGAFDNAWWPAIKVRLLEEGCPKNLRRVMDSYFQARKVKVRYAGEEHTRWTSKGCVQGSIGGPILWNLLLDPLLKGLENRGDYCQAFADDIVMVFEGHTGQEIQRQANAALAYVRDWGVCNKLKFAPQKTQAMVVTKKLKYDSPILHMGGTDIGLTKQIKILGLTIDSALTFNAHVDEVCRKSLNFYKCLSRAAKVQWGLGPHLIKTLYQAVVEPTIMYAASAWAPATNKLSVKKQLDAVQRGFAQKLTRAYKTVSLNGALLLAGILPLDIRIREAALLYETKKGYCRRLVGDREVETPVAFIKKSHPSQRTDQKFKCLVDGAELARHVGGNQCIFTDGSKLEGKVGAALSIWDGAAETKTVKLKLEPYCTVYQAELLALQKATEVALKNKVERCSIFCDARSALEEVARGDSLHPIAFQININLKTAEERRQKIELFWIKAHVGWEGNERADSLAKDAALLLKTKANYDRCPVSCLRRQIRQESIEEWSRRYEHGETASVTKLFFPNAVEAHKILKQLQVDPTTTQIFTGHGGFSEYLNRFRCKENSSCPCDPDIKETVPHILTECPIYERQRFEIEHSIETNITIENISNIMQNKDKRPQFIEYCKKVARQTIQRNK